MPEKSNKQKFPKILYVYKDGSGNETWLVACETVAEAADLDVTVSRLVGVYELKEVNRVSTNVTVNKT